MSESGTPADRRLHPAALVGRGLRQLPEYAVGLPVLASLTGSAGGLGVLALVGLGVAVALGVTLLQWSRFRWGVGAGEVVIESGVLFRQRRTIPFARIQDVDIEQGPLARLFGIARVAIETGSGGKDEGKLDSLALADAHRLRDTIRGRSAEAADDPSLTEPILFAMSPGRVLLSGALGFSLLSLAFIGAGIQYVDGLLPYDMIDWSGLGARRPHWGFAATVAAGAAFILALMLLALLIGVGRTLATDWRFTLLRAPNGLRRKRGLVTRSEVLIPLRRVQLALVRQAILARLTGWERLELQTLAGQSGRGGHQLVAPLAREPESAAILTELELAARPAAGDWTRVSARHILRQALRWTALALVPLTATTLAEPRLAALAFLLPFPALAAALQWRHHRYCPMARTIHIRSGILALRHWIVPYAAIRSLALRRSWLQRRLGLATIEIDTAGASTIYHPRIRNLRAHQAEALFQLLRERR